MADYRRLISYIYEYEGKQKGKNVGFAKLEARNGQCRINVNVKRIYMGGNAIGAYLLGTGGRETFLGNVFVRGGNGEFRANVDTKNVEGTGTGLDTYFGLSVHDVKNSWRCYKTIWEDALAAEEGNTGENPVLSVPKFTAEMLPEAEKEMTPQAVSKVVKEIEAEIAKEEERREQEEKTAHAAELRDEAQETEEASSVQGETTVQDDAEKDEKPKQEENSEEHGMVYLSEETEEIDQAEEKTDRAEITEQPDAVDEECNAKSCGWAAGNVQVCFISGDSNSDNCPCIGCTMSLPAAKQPDSADKCRPSPHGLPGTRKSGSPALFTGD